MEIRHNSQLVCFHFNTMHSAVKIHRSWKFLNLMYKLELFQNRVLEPVTWELLTQISLFLVSECRYEWPMLCSRCVAHKIVIMWCGRQYLVARYFLSNIIMTFEKVTSFYSDEKREKIPKTLSLLQNGFNHTDF